MKYKKRIMIVVGTRPEAIKMAPVYHELKKNNDIFDVIFCVTAQHREMLDQVLNTFEIKPDIDLNIMGKNQNLYDVTVKILQKMKKVFDEYSPHITLVHGDTTTTLAVSISSFYSKIKVCHVEAGLRTFDLLSPFPEELNRQVTSKISSFHFSPTENAKKNLIKENINENLISITGNTVIDSLLWILDKINKNKMFCEKLKSNLSKLLPFDYERDPFIIVTIHRRENFGLGVKNICSALAQIAKTYSHLNFIIPIHQNPNIKNVIKNELNNIKNVIFTNPMKYEEFAFLLSKSFFIMTDSGGIQEEAPALKKPVLVLRKNTERPEGVKSGTLKLVGVNKEKIIKNVKKLIEDEKFFSKMANSKNPYGDGLASNRIVNILKVV